MRTTNYREMIPFDLSEYDPVCEYFALEKDASKTCSYCLYAIGASKEVSIYRDGFLNPALAKDFLYALSERLYYFKEHPPVLVTKADLYKIANKKRLVEPMGLNDQMSEARKFTCWKKRSTCVHESKESLMDNIR